MSQPRRAASAMPRIVTSHSVFEGFNSFDVVTVEAPDRAGNLRRLKREVVDHGEGGVVLAIDRERGVALLVRQWRAPLLALGVDPFLLEACAGILDPGEEPEAAARREAEEELGLKIGSMHKIGAPYASAGTLTERMHLFIAEVSDGNRIKDGGGNPGEGEDIEVVELPLTELFESARRGEIGDAKTMILVQRLMIEELERRLGNRS
jgi:nudix-type nucleoside diphosphatase (YffH/AdpP family)